MALSISGAVAQPYVAPVQISPKVQAHAAVVALASTSTAKDTVKLSQSGQIHAMRQSGQGASQIASSLGVSLASVNSILGIAAAKVAAPVVEAKAAEVSAPEPSKAPVAAAAPAAAPVGVQAGPTPVAPLNVAKG